MSKQALLIVDMQRGLFATPRHDADAIVSRINALSFRLRTKHSPIVFIQHCGQEGDDLHPSQPGHSLHEGLIVDDSDIFIAKASCDAFLNTSLASTLRRLEVDEVIVTGFATDFCVDTTVRSALAQGFRTVVPEDGHTTADRPYLPTDKVIEHHNFVWANLVSPMGAARVTRCEAII